ncbi:MAG: hypothetical protein A3I61_08430 [Acidobacteria bacterium RIFCSPLOWO2_02_FULL_68_18]|nr:MAG: hypothetical protein A3I61_08430 [Acidobacteria bacterium RIFCSPLOWO2_02_FULL_68_18]OFW48876.1 MAG: hypothetical protein A3G77_01550 [Acidobacteria bacterium RIFCSPLOWO2_12_FULL_68_19]
MESSRPKLLDRVRQAIRTRHYSRRTEAGYVTWIRRYIVFHRKAHPATLGAADISAFLTRLATTQRVSASTQNQALAALLFLYEHVLQMSVGPVEHVVRAKQPVRLPVVLSRDEGGLARIIHEHRRVEETRSLRNAAPQAGKTPLRRIVGGHGVGAPIPTPCRWPTRRFS